MMRVVALSLLVASALAGQAKDVPKQEVVFVCEHGAAKSVIAAAYFNKLAKENGLAARAIARGTNLDETYAAAAVKGLKADGVEFAPGKPRAVTQAELSQASKVVALGCKIPDSTRGSTPVLSWDTVPSPSENYPAAREAIESNVEKLVKEMVDAKKKR